jgi:hypothetical protein
MDTLRLESYPSSFEEGILRFNIIINDRDFIEMVREVELPFAEKERGNPEGAGHYLGFTSLCLNDSFDSFIADGKMEILDCGGCGNEGCWPIIVKITTVGKTITWSNFYNPHRSANSTVCHWDHTKLGPFIFDKERYVSEFTRALNDLDEVIIPDTYI